MGNENTVVQTGKDQCVTEPDRSYILIANRNIYCYYHTEYRSCYYGNSRQNGNQGYSQGIFLYLVDRSFLTVKPEGFNTPGIS